ncbi:MAG: hypothetical protein ACC645_00065 [Pirellulales bacterium]
MARPRTSSADNHSDVGGPGHRTRFRYDGFDRLTSVIDAVGNQGVRPYDTARRAVRTLSFGPVGGRCRLCWTTTPL